MSNQSEHKGTVKDFNISLNGNTMVKENVILSGMLDQYNFLLVSTITAHLFTEVYIRGKTSTPPQNSSFRDTSNHRDGLRRSDPLCKVYRGVITVSPDSLGCQDASLSVESYREEPHESVSSSMEMQSSHKKGATMLECSQSESEYESANITVMENESVTNHSRLEIENQY